MENSPINYEAVTTADRIINTVCQTSKVTPDGKRWLKLALDPFPDETRTCGGFPDMISSKSNIVPLRLTTTVSGASFPTPWDCLIAFNGFTDSNVLYQTTKSGNRFTAVGQGATGYDIGGVQIRSALNSAVLGIPQITANLFAGMPTDRPWRLLSGGIEVHNETEPLYRSGKVICFRQPTVPSMTTVAGIIDAANASVNPVELATVTPLPETLSNAQNIPDSTNWDAEEGGYIVFAMDGPVNNVNVNPVNNGMIPAPNAVSGGANYFPLITGASPTQTVTGISNSAVPFNNCGLYFADLSPQTKLDVVVHLVVEQFPPVTDRTLTSLADPSAAYDPEALVLYSRALRQLPVAVRVSENGLGTFFLEAAKSIASWAAPKLLKGLDDPADKESKEIEKMRIELEVLKALQAQEKMRKLPPQPRAVQATPSGNVTIVPTGPKINKPHPPTTQNGNLNQPKNNNLKKGKLPPK